MTWTHRIAPHRSGYEQHTLTYVGDDGRGRIRWLHISDDEAWVLEWSAAPQRAGVGSKVMDVFTGRSEVDGWTSPGYRWFRAATEKWRDPFSAWAAHRHDITHKPRPVDPAAVMFSPDQRARVGDAMHAKRDEA